MRINSLCLHCVYTLTLVYTSCVTHMYNTLCVHTCTLWRTHSAVVVVVLPTSAARVRHFEMTGKDGDNDKAFQPTVVFVAVAAALVLRCCFSRRRIVQYFFARVSFFKCFLTFVAASTN